MANTDPRRLRFLMDVDEAILKVEKDYPSNPSVESIKDRFYSLASKEFARSTLGEVHEVTVENILKCQAQNFYKGFPAEIQDELINTFVEMEHQRRRDNFLGFCHLLFKQIECYVNFLFSNRNILGRVVEMRSEKAYTYYKSETKYGFTVQRVLLGKKKGADYFQDRDYDLYFNDKFSLEEELIKISDFRTKFKIISYMLQYNLVVSQEQFEQNSNTLNEIYQLRNTVHGGKFSTSSRKANNKEKLDWQETILLEAWNKRYMNYLKYMGFLADFMQKVSTSPNLEYAQ